MWTISSLHLSCALENIVSLEYKLEEEIISILILTPYLCSFIAFIRYQNPFWNTEFIFSSLIPVLSFLLLSLFVILLAWKINYPTQHPPCPLIPTNFSLDTGSHISLRRSSLVTLQSLRYLLLPCAAITFSFSLSLSLLLLLPVYLSVYLNR